MRNITNDNSFTRYHDSTIIASVIWTVDDKNVNICMLGLAKIYVCSTENPKTEILTGHKNKKPFHVQLPICPRPPNESLLKANAALSHLKPPNPELINVSSFKAIGLKCSMSCMAITIHCS